MTNIHFCEPIISLLLQVVHGLILKAAYKQILADRLIMCANLFKLHLQAWCIKVQNRIKDIKATEPIFV